MSSQAWPRRYAAALSGGRWADRLFFSKAGSGGFRATSAKTYRIPLFLDNSGPSSENARQQLARLTRATFGAGEDVGSGLLTIPHLSSALLLLSASPL